ncbi:hypothetical protein ES703_40332 [subsurface metagenome]
MLKVSLARKHHCDAVFISSGNYFIIFIRAARLNQIPLENLT